MNAEIYFPRNGMAFGQTSEKSFEDTIKKLANKNLHIIYKTEVNLTEDSIVEALKVTESGEDKIGVVFIADALESDNAQKAKKFFEDIGITGKVKRIETDCKNPLENTDSSGSGAANNGGKKKNSPEPEIEYIDINGRVKSEFDDPEGEDTQSSKNVSGSKKKQKEKNNEQTPQSEGELIDISSFNVSVEKKKFYAYTVEYKDKLIVLLPPAENLDTDFMTVIYTAGRKIMAPKKKRAFWKRIIPCKGDSAFDVIRKVILLVAIATFVVSSYMLLDILVLQPWKNDKLNERIKDVYSEGSKTPDDAKKPKDGSEGILSDFSKLIEKNPDTIGWITVPKTPVDYVVVKSPLDEQRVSNGEDPYYLYTDFEGNYSKYGTVFMDYRSNLDSKNMIIHGHHMQDGRMFAKLLDFCDLDKYKETPVFTFDTLYEKSKWKIISVFKTNTLKWHGDPVFNYLRGSFSSKYDFINFVYQLRVRSMIDCPVSVNENDTLLTLSTCCYDFQEFRFVIVARKVRDGESATVDVSNAQLNPTPLYPQVCHDYWGVSKPLVTSFQDAYNNGRIDWYDGDGKWSEDDDQELIRHLIEGKERAEKLLKESYKKTDYNKEQLDEIEAIIENYMERINAAEKGSDVKELYDQAVTEIQKVKTIKQLKAEEDEAKKQALKESREQAMQEINDSTAGKRYQSQEKMDSIIKKYKDLIYKSVDADRITELKEKAIKELAAIEKKDTEESSKQESSKQESSKQESSKQESSKQESSKQESSKQESSRQESSRQEEPSRDDESSKAAELAQYKVRAVSVLYGYIDSEASDFVKSGVASLITQNEIKINNASSKDEIDSLLEKAERAIHRKAAELAEEEARRRASEDEDLAIYKTEAINSLNGYLDLSKYSESVRTSLNDLIIEYAGYINSALSKSDVDSLLNEAKGDMDIIAKEEEQSSEQSTEQSSEQSTENSEEQSQASAA